MAELTPLEAWKARVQAAVARYVEREGASSTEARDDEAREPGRAARATERNRLWTEYRPPTR